MQDDLSDLESQENEGQSQGDAPPAADQQSEIRKRESENAKLREELRTERAKRLVAQHGLPESFEKRLAKVPRDEQEAWAEDLAKLAATAAGEEPAAEVPPEEVAAIEQMAQTQPATPTRAGEVTPKNVADLIHSGPVGTAAWLRLKDSNPVLAEKLLQGETVTGVSLT